MPDPIDESTAGVLSSVLLLISIGGPWIITAADALLQPLAGLLKRPPTQIQKAIQLSQGQAAPISQTYQSPNPSKYDTCQRNDQQITLYHYARQRFLKGILDEGLRPSQQIPGDNSSDAQWGDGQYLTDLTPEESSTVTRGQHSYALFKNPRKWGTSGNLENIAWIAFNLPSNDVDQRAPLFGFRFPQRSIYLRWSHKHPDLSLMHNMSSDLAIGNGIVTFQRTPFTGEIIP